MTKLGRKNYYFTINKFIENSGDTILDKEMYWAQVGIGNKILKISSEISVDFLGKHIISLIDYLVEEEEKALWKKNADLYEANNSK